MKRVLIACVACTGIGMFLLGAGCSNSNSPTAKAAPNSEKQPFIQRRTTEPPTPPAHIPPPTPIQPTSTGE